MLTATRPGEVRHAQWGEFDLEAAVWTIPATRYKTGTEFRVPLSLNPPARWGLWVWRVHQKGLLTWENAVVSNGHSGHVRRHFL